MRLRGPPVQRTQTCQDRTLVRQCGTRPGRRTGARLCRKVVIVGHGDRDPVIELDERGIDLLKSCMHPRTQVRVTVQPDGSIVLHPMSAPDAELWQSGLVEPIVENFSRPERMIRLKVDKL
jgi:hypothetical protein